MNTNVFLFYILILNLTFSIASLTFRFCSDDAKLCCGGRTSAVLLRLLLGGQAATWTHVRRQPGLRLAHGLRFSVSRSHCLHSPLVNGPHHPTQ